MVIAYGLSAVRASVDPRATPIIGGGGFDRPKLVVNGVQNNDNLR